MLFRSLDPNRTSPYKFYQFWLNTSDEDAAEYIKKFTLLPKEEIDTLAKEHAEAPHLRILQKALAKDVTIRVHSIEDYNAAIEASEILFGKGTTETLKRLSEDTFLSIFEGVPQFELAKNDVVNGMNVVDFLADKTQIFPSKSEARRMLKEGGVSINKTKVEETATVETASLLNEKYILVQKGKKNYFLVKVL